MHYTCAVFTEQCKKFGAYVLWCKYSDGGSAIYALYLCTEQCKKVGAYVCVYVCVSICVACVYVCVSMCRDRTMTLHTGIAQMNSQGQSDLSLSLPPSPDHGSSAWFLSRILKWTLEC